VELFETTEAAIKREVKEEIDAEIEILDYLGLVDHIVSSEGVHGVVAELF
jgi:ADP-ribose pyrophosphatase YjhB (NUDIX family)